MGLLNQLIKGSQASNKKNERKGYGFDDPYNTIEGFGHSGGYAQGIRQHMTDFGSGSKIALRLFKEANENLGKSYDKVRKLLGGAKGLEAINYKQVPRVSFAVTEGNEQILLNVMNPSVLKQSIGALEKESGKAITRKEASQMAFMQYGHELFEAGQYSSISTAEREAFEKAGKGLFSSHINKQVIEDEAFWAYSLGEESFEAMKKFRRMEAASSLNVFSGMRKEVQEKYKGISGFFKRKQKKMEEEVISKIESPILRYTKEVEDIYRRAPQEAEEQLREMGLRRLNVSSKRLEQEFSWVRETSSVWDRADDVKDLGMEAKAAFTMEAGALAMKPRLNQGLSGAINKNKGKAAKKLRESSHHVNALPFKMFHEGARRHKYSRNDI